MMENRRRYPRYRFEVLARLHTSEFSLAVKVVDISQRGIGILTDRHIAIGTEVTISLYPFIEDPIAGIPVWSSYLEHEKEYYYRIGVETEYIALAKLKLFGFPLSPEDMESDGG